MQTVAVVYGTRPEIIKLAPVVNLIRESVLLVNTGQHFDPAMSGRIAADLEMPEADLTLEVGGKTRSAQIAHSMLGLESVLRPMRGVVVQGDTNSALAGGLGANALGVPLFHIESGLRSYDRRMPEEHNRVLIDHLADVCWAPTDVNLANLAAEGIPDQRVEKTGNTIIEALETALPPDHQVSSLLDRHDVSRHGFVITTLHRPENVDDPIRLRDILEKLAKVPIPVLFPMHPRTAATVEKAGLHALLAPLQIVEPLGYRDFLGLLGSSALAISDSGGIQEEVSVLKVPVIVVRRSTERPEVLGTFADLTDDPGEMLELAIAILEDGGRLGNLAAIPSPYGDGKASMRMVESLRRREIV